MRDRGYVRFARGDHDVFRDINAWNGISDNTDEWRAQPWNTPEEDEEDSYPLLPGDTFTRLSDPRSFR